MHIAIWEGSVIHRISAVSISLGNFAHVAPDNAEVREVLASPRQSFTYNSVRMSCLKVKSGALLYHVQHLRRVSGTAAFADDAVDHSVSDGPDHHRLLLPFPHRAALTVVISELYFVQAYAMDNESVDAEDALFPPGADNIEALWFPVHNLESLSNTEFMVNASSAKLVEICPSVLVDLQNERFHGCRQQISRHKKPPTAVRNYRCQISKSNSEIPQRRCKLGCGKSNFHLIISTTLISGYAKTSF